MRPNHRHDRTHYNRGKGANNRHKARTAEETKELRQRDFIETAMQRAGDKPNHHPTKYACFQRLNTQRHPLAYGSGILVRQRSVECQ